MKKLLAGVAVVSGVFFGQPRANANSATKWQQFCEAAPTDAPTDAPTHAMADLNGRLKQLGEEGWELTGLTPSGAASVACFKRTLRASASPPLAAAVAPMVVAPMAVAPMVVEPVRVIAAVAPPIAAPLKVAPAAKPVLVAKAAPIKEAEVAAPHGVAPEPAPAITAAAAEIMAAPNATQATVVKPSQAQVEVTPPSRSLLPDEQNEAPRPRRALVPKS